MRALIRHGRAEREGAEVRSRKVTAGAGSKSGRGIVAGELEGLHFARNWRTVMPRVEWQLVCESRLGIGDMPLGLHGADETQLARI
jgi:hypothetical protein